MRLNGIAPGRVLLLLAVLLSIAAFKLPSGHVHHGSGVDPSIRYAANVYRDHDLEFGRDIVHVFGPLGYITYPVAGNDHLLHASLVAAALRLLLIVGVAFFALKTGKYVDASLILVVCAFFFAQRSRVHETHVYGVCVVLFLLDLRIRATGLGLMAAATASLFTFVKFNMAITLSLLTVTHLIVARVFFGERLTKTVAKSAVFLVGLTTFARLCFSSFPSVMLWIKRSWGIATGNSEAMSLLAHDTEVVVAALTMLTFVATGFFILRLAGRSAAISWVAITAIPLFFEFKHGFVRADAGHISNFFFFAPVAVASSLMFATGRQLRWMLLGTFILALIGPSIRFESPNLLEWASGVRFQGVRFLARAEEHERSATQRNEERLQDGGLSKTERTLLRGRTVDFVPQDVTFLAGTGAMWRPSPFFQYLLVRNPTADLINSRHIASEEGAEFMILRWCEVNKIHPWYWAPTTYEAILNNYHLVSRTDDRLLLQRPSRYRLEPVALGSTSGTWKIPIAVPKSDCMVLAAIRLTPTFLGRILKAFYRVPPVYITLDRETTYRFVPGTAPNGLVVSRVPRGLLQLECLLRHGRVHPSSQAVNSFTLRSEGSVAYFGRQIEISFYEVGIHRRGAETF